MRWAGLATGDPRERTGRVPATSVNDSVVGLGASLADPVVVHPTYRFALLALSAGPEVPSIIENARGRTVDLGFGRGRWKFQPDHPGGDGRVWTVPVDFADENADSTFGSLHANELIEKLAVIPARGFLARLSITLSGRLERPLPTLHGVDNLLRGNLAEIDVRGREIRMPELLLNNIDGRVLAGQLASVRMAKTVEMNPLLDARLATKATHECPDVALEKGLALQSADDRLPTIQAQLSTAVQPALD